MNEIMDSYNWANRLPVFESKADKASRWIESFASKPSTNFGGRDNQFGCVEGEPLNSIYMSSEGFAHTKPLETEGYIKIDSKEKFKISHPITAAEVAELQNYEKFNDTSLAEEMVKYETLFPGSKRKSNAVKPEEKSKDHDMLIIQAHRIEFLENEVRLRKDSLIKLEKSISTRLNDYNNLEVDYLNSQSENKKLQEQLDKVPGLKRTLQWFMIEHLEMDIKLGK